MPVKERRTFQVSEAPAGAVEMRVVTHEHRQRKPLWIALCATAERRHD